MSERYADASVKMTSELMLLRGATVGSVQAALSRSAVLATRNVRNVLFMVVWG